MSVEDWAEIRRLHRAERGADQADRPGAGDLEEHGAGGVARGGPAQIRAGGRGSIVDEVEPRIRELLAA